MNETMHTEHEIIICTKCKGTGIVDDRELCDECNGSGRLFKIYKWSKTVVPFNPKRGMINIRRKLK